MHELLLVCCCCQFNSRHLGRQCANVFIGVLIWDVFIILFALLYVVRGTVLRCDFNPGKTNTVPNFSDTNASSVCHWDYTWKRFDNILTKHHYGMRYAFSGSLDVVGRQETSWYILISTYQINVISSIWRNKSSNLSATQEGPRRWHALASNIDNRC